MLGRLPLLALIAIALPAAAVAQPRHLINRGGVEEGLPNNALAGILQTRDGYLWIATWAGTVRFDGVRFTPIAENLPNDHARALFEDRDGSVWIGVAGTGLARWRQNELEVFTPAQGLAGNDPRTILQDADGRIWAGTENGLSIVGPTGVDTRRVTDGLPDNNVTSLALSRSGEVWVATARGLCLASAARRACKAAGPPIAGRVDAVLEDRESRLWIGTPQGLISRGAGHAACPDRCLAGVAVTALLQTRDGAVWAGLGTGAVARLHAGGIDWFGTQDGLPPGNVVSMYEDAEGSLWVATYNGGLARIKPKRVGTFSTADGVPADAIGSIVQDHNGDIWAGSQCGPVSILRRGRFAAAACIAGPAGVSNTSVLPRDSPMATSPHCSRTVTASCGSAPSSAVCTCSATAGCRARTAPPTASRRPTWRVLRKIGTAACGLDRTRTVYRCTSTASSGRCRRRRARPRATLRASSWTAAAICGSAAPPTGSSAAATAATAATSRSASSKVSAIGWSRW